jgi:hypothetical protein
MFEYTAEQHSTLPSDGSSSHTRRSSSILVLMLRLIVLLSADVYRDRLGIGLCDGSFILIVLLTCVACQFDQGKRCSSAWRRMATSSCLRFSNPTRPALPSRWRQALMLATAPFLTKVRKPATRRCQKTGAFCHLFLCLSRACLGKTITFTSRSGTNTDRKWENQTIVSLTSCVDTRQISTASRRHTRTSPPRPFPTLWAASAPRTSRCEKHLPCDAILY